MTTGKPVAWGSAFARCREPVDVFKDDPTPVICWSTPLECHEAAVRATREKRVSRQESSEATDRLREVRGQSREVVPLESVRTRAMRLLLAHALRTADGQRLAASLVWCEEQRSGETFFCLDQRLREAARREGFTLLPTDVWE